MAAGNAVVTASFLGALALVTWREFNNPAADAPLPVPAPYRYTGTAVVFGLTALVGDVFSERIAAVVASGLLIGLAFQTAQSYKSWSGKTADKESPAK